MAHEIAHVAARHGTRNATKGEIMQWASIPLILLGPEAGQGMASTRGSISRSPLATQIFPGCRTRGRLSGFAIYVQGGL